ncbi:hypothetical protein [Trinickia soli]|uniref:Uncharacterized protein n=1 Tax=Trinickia soli TaxID=380675 RepID=A0A2N7VJ27_9BURK|nr:hypothetical protein [Trinickia soli]KAA0084853.1 hypothetical protein CIW54_17235 [Paraburkholderia sp. T12-10]PMS17159.1 hypothetical protein C0Z19_24980 [Trinickia soli]CAB3716827.1 hypothetical protein LMG24076_04362 [Trinickia soli]
MDSDNRDPAGQAPASVTVVATTLAAYYIDDNSIKPCCWVNVYGPPGDTVYCDLTGGELIVPPPGNLYDGDGTSYGTGPYKTTFDNNGGGVAFLVRAPYSLAPPDVSKLFAIVVTAKDPSGGPTATGNPSFQKYTDANPYNHPNKHLVGYNFTTGAAADGVAPCCVYVKADSDKWKVVRVSVDGSATIVASGGSQQRDVELEEDGTAVIMIVDKTAETVNVNVSLPNSPGTEALAPFQVSFVDPPKVQVSAA